MSFKREGSISMVELVMSIKAETGLAYLVFDGDSEVWIPKSKVENMELGKDDMATFEIPEWLALKKGFI